jgi:hypothetical protein
MSLSSLGGGAEGSGWASCAKAGAINRPASVIATAVFARIGIAPSLFEGEANTKSGGKIDSWKRLVARQRSSRRVFL